MWWECSECGGQVERARPPAVCGECGMAGAVFAPLEAGDDGAPAAGSTRDSWLLIGMERAATNPGRMLGW